MKNPLPPDEESRLKELHSYEILDTLPEGDFDDLTRLASEICGTPISAISLVDRERQWFKSIQGLEASETSRDVSFCAHTMFEAEVMVVNDATRDPRFADNALVTGAPGIRFYAGAPITTPSGVPLGALCVIDRQPRQISESQKQALSTLARSVMTQLELRRKVAELEREAALREKLERIHKEREFEQTLKLRESEALFKAFMDNIPALCYIKDHQGRFVYVNSYFSRVLNISLKEAIGETDAILFPPEQFAAITAVDAAILARNEARELIEVAATPDGVTRQWLSCKFPFRGGSSPHSMLAGVSFDVSERFELEEELRSARDAALDSVRLKSEFLATMSHEIRTPMNGVIGMTGLLLDTPLSEKQRDYASTIRSCADSLLNIINDILDFSKIEAGKMSFEEIEFDVWRVAGEVVEMLAGRAHAKQLDLQLFIDGGVPRTLSGDSGRFRQVLTNLVSNAVKFTERGQVSVRVSPKELGATFTTLLVEVADTGMGISPEDQRHLFRPFTQADGSMTRRFGGTGLGLAISKQLVEMMNGRIWLESVPHEGSRFSFTVRFRNLDHVSHEFEHSSQTQGLRVLLVDSSPSFRDILEQQLLSWKMQATQAQNGMQAIEYLTSSAADGRPFDFALIDLRLEDMSGIDLAARLHKNADLVDLKVFLMTPYDWDGDSRRLEGVKTHLRKPFRPSQLLDSLISFSAPASPNGSPTPAAETAETANTHLRKPHGKVLLVEDNPVNSKLALTYLEKFGYSAETVVNGKEAVQALAENQYDIVLMDCQMPIMNGFDATRLIREREALESRRPTPVVALTANAMQGDRDRCIQAGMDDYVAKPLDGPALHSALERWRPLTQASLDGLADQFERAQPALGRETGLELIAIFIPETTSRLAEIRARLRNADTTPMNSIFHSLAGDSGALGLKKFSDLSRELEALCLSPQRRDILPLLQCLEDEFYTLCGRDLEIIRAPGARS